MKKLILLLAVTGLYLSPINAQNKLSTRTGKITFLSKTPIENIYAENNQSASIFVVDQNKIAFNVLLKSFKFEKALMEEHFNEKYVHSDTYPSAKFEGKLLQPIDLKEAQKYSDVPIEGNMIFHGVTRPLKVLADIVVNEDQTLSIATNFKLNLKEYKVEIPSLVEEKIAKDIEVAIAANYK